MKFVVAIILLTINLNTLAQKRAFKVYKIIDHKSLFGEHISFDTIHTTGKTDLSFFQKHFYYPQLPIHLKDTRYKNQTVVEWANNNDTVLNSINKANWKITYTYDFLSRIVDMTYSGCVVCNSTSYSYKLTYNANGWINSLAKITMGFQERYVIDYDLRGDISRLDYFDNTGLSRSMILVW